ncbi:transcriptional regulator [Mycobacterium sp. 21AC1]|uniref:TrmB family transcriptional regulator n=1 Tax=[Mycobacterium] appelbergii TaxID=2939269 RepID=UPI002938D638|nr:helix-turn-helix domain-containing protein [Mycobacterium sp. 21AC1]MDV3126004.1 transcriptional regulator [Mycobacterium sp. 21AC1]
MWKDLVEAGLDPKDAHFYLAVLRRGRATVAEAAREANVSRTGGYDIARRLQDRGLLARVESEPGESGDLRTQSHLVASDPIQLLEEWADRRRVLDDVVPQLRALFSESRARPKVRYLEGPAGIRSALFETLEWASPICGVLSMRDLMTVPGEAAMDEYITGRRERELVLRVIRTRDHDWPGGWLTSAQDFRIVKHAPAAYEFTMTEIIGTHEVVSLSSARETFAMVIESQEYAEMQRNFFEVLWAASSDAAVDGGKP